MTALWANECEEKGLPRTLEDHLRCGTLNLWATAQNTGVGVTKIQKAFSYLVTAGKAVRDGKDAIKKA